MLENKSFILEMEILRLILPHVCSYVHSVKIKNRINIESSCDTVWDKITWFFVSILWRFMWHFNSMHFYRLCLTAMLSHQVNKSESRSNCIGVFDFLLSVIKSASHEFLWKNFILCSFASLFYRVIPIPTLVSSYVLNQILLHMCISFAAI